MSILAIFVINHMSLHLNLHLGIGVFLAEVCISSEDFKTF